MLELIRKTAVSTVKPLVSRSTWDALRRLEPNPRRRARSERLAQQRERAATNGNGAGAPAVAAEATEPMSQWDLVRLARHFGTDKWGAHRYVPHYEHHFRPFKNDAITLLEIGIGGYSRERQGGASLRMWKAFFPRAEIIGLDIEDKSFVVEPRITAYRGSQVNEPLLRTIVSEAKNLRIVIDDGSHRPEHVRRTFEILFPLLPAGSLYAIEDTQTSYWPRYGGRLDLNDESTTMALVKRMVDGLNYEEWQDETYKATYADRNIVAVHCYHNLVVLEKGPNNEGTNRASSYRKPPTD